MRSVIVSRPGDLFRPFRPIFTEPRAGPAYDQRQVAQPRRFLTVSEVADEFAASTAQMTALVRRGDLPAFKLGGRGQWHVERAKLEEFIAQAYDDTARQIQAGDIDDGDGGQA